MKKRGSILTLSLSLLLTACSTTELLQEGKTKFYEGNKLDNIVVIAYPAEQMDIRTFENKAVNAMRSKEVKASPAHQVFLEFDSVPKDALSIRNSLKEKGYTGLVEIKLVKIRNVETSSEYDYPTRREYRIMDVAHYGELIQEYGKRVDKGATFEDVKVKMDFRVIDLSQSEPQVIWSARTDTDNPKTGKNVAGGMTNKVMKPLKKNNILGQ